MGYQHLRRVIVAALFLFSLVAVTLIVVWSDRSDTAVGNGSRDNELHNVEDNSLVVLQRDSVAEAIVDFGRVDGSELSSRTLRFTNSTDSPIVLLSYEATCRCVWLDMPRVPIGTGESADVILYFDSRGEWGSIGNYISVLCSDEDVNVAIWMSAEVE